MASWVIVASYCLLFASPVFGGGSSLCTYPLSEIKTLVFVNSVNDTWYYFSPCGNSIFDDCGTATLCVTTSRNTFSPYSDALLTRSSDGLYKISYNSSGLEMELWFSDGSFINCTFASVLDEQVTLQTVEMANEGKPGIVGDESENTQDVNSGKSSSTSSINLAVAMGNNMSSHNGSSRMVLSSISSSVIRSHPTALPFSSNMSDEGLRTSSPFIASPSGTLPLNSPDLTTVSPSSPIRTTLGQNISNVTTSSLMPTITTNGPMPTTITNGPVPTITTNGPMPTTVTNSPMPTTITNGSMPTTVTNGPMPTTITNGPMPTTITNGPMPTMTTNSSMPSSPTNGPLPTITASVSLPTSTPSAFPSANGSVTPPSPSITHPSSTSQSAHTSSSSSSNSQASSTPGSSPSTGLTCTTKIVIAVSVTFVATAVLAVIATLAVLIFYKRRAKKGSSYVQLAPTVYFDDDDE